MTWYCAYSHGSWQSLQVRSKVAFLGDGKNLKTFGGPRETQGVFTNPQASQSNSGGDCVGWLLRPPGLIEVQSENPW